MDSHGCWNFFLRFPHSAMNYEYGKGIPLVSKLTSGKTPKLSQLEPALQPIKDNENFKGSFCVVKNSMAAPQVVDINDVKFELDRNPSAINGVMVATEINLKLFYGGNETATFEYEFEKDGDENTYKQCIKFYPPTDTWRMCADPDYGC